MHVDLVGPWPASKVYTHLLTVIDRFTRWPEAIPLAQTDAASIGSRFALHWIARFGVPADITSDRGGAIHVGNMASALGIAGSQGASHNGLPSPGERIGRKISQIVKGRITSSADDGGLDGRSSLGHARVENSAEGASVADMVYGVPLTVPGTFFVPNNGPDAAGHLQHMRDIAGRLVPAPDAWHGTQPTTNNRGLTEAEFVFVRRDASHGPLQMPYTGPYRVLQRHDKYFVIQCGEREESVSVDRLKPANAKPDRPIQPAIPPRRGQPPKQREVRPATDEDPAERSPEPEPEQ